MIYFAAKIGGGLVSEYDALNRLSAFGISSQSMYAENGFYWESGTSDFSPYFTGEDVNGYEFVYLADDFNDDGLDEAEAFVLMAIPKDTGSGSTAYYTDEYCRSFQAVVDTGHMRDELLSFSASDVEWDYDPNATEPRIRAFESLQSYTSSG
ncbi:MAG: hypothetical protein U5N86_12185 [Planctomycetota bacterium]|nr:hypothetical protein [Planctomycetota bacterium]